MTTLPEPSGFTSPAPTLTKRSKSVNSSSQDHSALLLLLFFSPPSNTHTLTHLFFPRPTAGEVVCAGGMLIIKHPPQLHFPSFWKQQWDCTGKRVSGDDCTGVLLNALTVFSGRTDLTFFLLCLLSNFAVSCVRTLWTNTVIIMAIFFLMAVKLYLTYAASYFLTSVDQFLIFLHHFHSQDVGLLSSFCSSASSWWPQHNETYHHLPKHTFVHSPNLCMGQHYQ